MSNFPRKYLLVGGLALAFIFALILYKAATKDSVRPQLDELAKDQSLIIAIATDAATKTTDLKLQTAAANAEIVLTSHGQQLNDYYKDQYGKGAPVTKEATITSSTGGLLDLPAGADYDAKAKGFLDHYLNTDLVLTGKFSHSANTKLASLAQQLYQDQSDLLMQLE